MITSSEKQTIAFGQEFAKKLNGGEVVLLIGDLGAGKTTFVKGVAKAFGVKQMITSPTFVLMKVYSVITNVPVFAHVVGRATTGRRIGTNISNNKRNKINFLVHIDTYRGLDINDLETIGALEYFGREDAICFVEWGKGLENYLKEKGVHYYMIRIDHLDENKRQITIK